MSKCFIILPCPIVYKATNQVDQFQDSFVAQALVELENMIGTSAQFVRKHLWDLKKNYYLMKRKVPVVLIPGADPDIRHIRTGECQILWPKNCPL